MLSTSAKQDYRWVAIGAFLWVGALMFVGVNTLFKRQDVSAAIQNSPEYRCLAATTGKQVVVRWSALRNLREVGTGFTVGMLVETPGTNCIPDGDAVSFAMLPESAGTSLSAVRIRGREAKAVYRQTGQWADVTDATGAERWRNDGAGYRKVSP
jgi:hypothetical protein